VNPADTGRGSVLERVRIPEWLLILFQWIDGKLQSVYPRGWAQRAAITTRLPWAGRA
jgi:hypothetical protein